MMRNKNLFAALAVTMILPILPNSAVADNLSSPWIIDEFTKSRLFVGGYDREHKILHIGWQVSMKAGWKTYWRSPGDAGLPPRWDWENIKNIKRISVLWPAPEFARIFDMDSYIYHQEVILPIDVEIKDDKAPTFLMLNLEYMVCSEICVPKNGVYSLDISSLQKIKIPLFSQAQLNRFRALVPIKISGHDIVVRVDPAGAKTLLIDLPDSFAPDTIRDVENIIVEGKKGQLLGRAVQGDKNNSHHYMMAFHNDPPAKGQILTLTFLQKGGGAQQATVTIQ